jgi:hypothetical protein
MAATRGVVRFVLLCSLIAACGDNDHPGGGQLLVTPQTGLHTSESGGTATFMVMLTAAPASDVSVSVVSSNTNEGVVTPPTLSFTAKSYNIPQPVTIVGVDDSIPDGNQGYTVRVAADALGAVDVDVTNDDNDLPGVVVTPQVGLMTTEAGGQATFTVALTAQPSADVTIPMASSDLTEGNIDQNSLTFTSQNWNAPQTVTVTGIEDNIADGPIAYTIVLSPCQSSDPHFNDIDPDDVALTNIDDDSPGFLVTPTSGLQTTEAGGTDTFTVVLNSQPSADVTVAVASNDATEASASTQALTFTAQNWNAPQTVTVTGVDDHIADGDQPFTIVLSPAVSSDPGYSGVDPDDVMGLNLDNDSAGFLVTPTSGLHTTEAGGQDTFTVVLLSQPAADVTVGVASNDPCEVPASHATVTFTSANWNAPQTVTVKGQDDFIADGNQVYTIVTSPAVSADAQYNSLDPDDVQVTNLDNDSAGVVVTPTSGLVTTEGGGAAQFTVVLQSQPIADVQIPVASSDLTEGTVSTAQLTFTSANWNAPQTVIVTGKDDLVADGDQVYRVVLSAASSADAAYNTVDPSDVTVTNLDNDAAGILVSPTSGRTTTESGGTAQFSVVLLSQPTANVTITVASNDTTEGKVSTNLLLFTPANWDAPQTVTITGQDDAIADGDQPYKIVLSPATSTDPSYSGLDPADVSAVNLDNDSAGILVSPTTGLQTTEAGGTDSFTVVLLSQPTQNVTISVASSDTTEGTVSTSLLTFTPVNWNAPQTVTVTGQDDFIADGNQPYTIVLGAATSADAGYNGRDPQDVSATNLDNDSPGIRVTPTSGLVTTEAGGQATFTIVLLSQPIANVTINLTSSDLTEGTVAPASVTFTPLNWNAPQTVTVTGKDDAVADGDQAYKIVTAAASSVDPGYSGLNASDVSVTNLDNDVAGIIVTPTSGLVTTEAGGTDTFTVELRSQPTSNVTITLASSDTTEGTVSTTSLTFTAANWNAPQTVTVIGQDDGIVDGDQVYTVVTNPATSLDAKYSGLDAANVSVTNLDNDSAGILVSPTSGLVTSENGDSDVFTVVLLSQPSADVTINVSSNDATEGTVVPTSLTFTSANWNQPQSVTVTGVDDALADGNQVYQVILAPATSADPAYNGINPNDVTVTNTDNDVAGFTVDPTSGLVVSEFGDTDFFTIVLNTQPLANVTVTLTSSDHTEGTVSPASVTFTPANWNTPQTVTVTGVNDTIVDGNQVFTIVTGVATSADPAYNGINPPDVSVTNIDNETPQVYVKAHPHLKTSESGQQVTLKVRLTVAPTAQVTCTVHSSDLTEGTVSPTTLTFTAANFGNQNVVVKGVDDTIKDGDQLYTVIFDACTSADPSYNGYDPIDVSVVNRDND